MNDLRFALRQLLKSPGFTFLAVITLALGIGLNTAIFSLINDLFLRGLPFKEPGRVLHMYSNAKDRNLLEIAVSAPRYQHYRDGQTMFDGFAGENIFAFSLTGLGDPVQLFGGKVTSNYFDVLGVRPIRGRNFLPQEEDTADVAMVTENFWQKRMGGDANVIGRSITLDGVPHTIVGVLPNLPFSWTGPNAEVWTTKPFVIPGFSYERMMRGTGFLRVVGRLKPGMTLEQARAALPSLNQSYRSQYPDKIDSSATMSLKTLPEDVTGNLRPAFATLLAAVAFVLLIACSNVANLLLVRFTGRRREIALRMALGASRASVLRLFIFESLLVSVLAGVVGGNEWEPAPTSIPQNFGRRAGGPICHAACRRRVAHHQLCPVEPAEHWVPRQKSLDWPRYIAASAISRSTHAPTFRGTNSRRVAHDSDSPKRNDQRRHSAARRRWRCNPLLALGR